MNVITIGFTQYALLYKIVPLIVGKIDTVRFIESESPSFFLRTLDLSHALNCHVQYYSTQQNEKCIKSKSFQRKEGDEVKEALIHFLI